MPAKISPKNDLMIPFNIMKSRLPYLYQSAKSSITKIKYVLSQPKINELFKKRGKIQCVQVMLLD